MLCYRVFVIFLVRGSESRHAFRWWHFQHDKTWKISNQAANWQHSYTNLTRKSLVTSHWPQCKLKSWSFNSYTALLYLEGAWLHKLVFERNWPNIDPTCMYASFFFFLTRTPLPPTRGCWQHPGFWLVLSHISHSPLLYYYSRPLLLFQSESCQWHLLHVYYSRSSGMLFDMSRRVPLR